MEGFVVVNTTIHRPPPPRSRALLYVKPMATYDQVVGAFNNDYGLETLLNSCSRYVDKNDGSSFIIDPVALLKEVTKHTRTMTRGILPYDCSDTDVDEDMKKMPFRYNHDNKDQFVEKLLHCPRYPDLTAKLFNGIFTCHNKKAAEQDANDADQNTPFKKIITDVDLLCVFVAMVALQSRVKISATREKLFFLIFESLRAMKDIFRDQWKNWPFTRLAGGSKTRDERTFDALFGFDSRDGRKNHWMSVPEAFFEYKEKNNLIRSVHDIFNTECDNNCCENRVYVGRPVYDMVQFLPAEAHELLFGKKLANVLLLCYNYSVGNMPYVLASDTHPVKAGIFPSPIVPSGCCRKNRSGPLLPTNNMTLVSRHAIPSSRKLGIYLLNRKSSLHPYFGLGRGVAECMTHSSINDEQAVIKCPESEIKCLDRHISKLFMRNNKNTKECCGLCCEKLNVEPVFDEAPESAYDYFPLHAFMDTYEAAENICFASLCPDCVVRIVLFTYEKVSSGSVAISDAFRCPCCEEYMINWLGRGSEVSRLCKRLLLNSLSVSSSSREEYELTYKLMKRIETCFSSLEMLQDDFMSTALSPFDFLYSKESKFVISRPTLRPPVRRYKLTKGNVSNRYSLNCVYCVSPMCCDRPDEYLDIETVDVMPPPTPRDPNNPDVEDMEFDVAPLDERIRYDDGPGTHRWPARLSCSFVSFNTPRDDKEIKTCAEAIALLGRIPQKKRRGWCTESPEGKAIVALGNWYKKNQPPENMQELLTAVSSVFKTRDCFHMKALHHPFVAARPRVTGVVSQIKVSEDPLVAAYFGQQKKKCQNRQLMEYAGLFTRSLISECLLQMPECVYHRASCFVLYFADLGIILGKRPDEAARLDYVKSLHVTRRNMATGVSSPISYTLKQERTVEWAVEKGGEQLKTVTCFNCETPAIKKGGCVAVTCGTCHKLYCWLCEKPIRDSDHLLIEHGLFYCTSDVARKMFENFYNVEIATLQLHKFRSLGDDVEMYVMEDGFSFDVIRKRAYRTKSMSSIPRTAEQD